MALNFPNIDPVLLSIGPLKIHWYGVAYVAGILLGVFYARILAGRSGYKADAKFFEDITVAVVIGIILGGKTAYLLFYDIEHFIATPVSAIFSRSGFAFHGGMLGAIFAIIIVCKRYKKSYWQLLDIGACVAPIGIFLGRISNFINGELFGRITDMPWGMRFPYGGNYPRHPSQLYESFAEGLLLFIILNVLFIKYKAYKSPKLLTALGLILYGAFRTTIEFFREPDEQLGLFFSFITMGQILSGAMILSGGYLIWQVQRRRN